MTPQSTEVDTTARPERTWKVSKKSELTLPRLLKFEGTNSGISGVGATQSGAFGLYCFGNDDWEGALFAGPCQLSILIFSKRIYLELHSSV